MKLQTMSAFARLVGADRSTINRSAGSGLLKPAMKGKKLDLDHPNVEKFIKKYKGRKPGSGKKKKKPEEPRLSSDVNLAETDIRPDDLPEDVRKLADKPFKEIIRIFGTDVRFETWLKSAKGIEELHEKKLKNLTTEGNLIPREFVEKHVFGFLKGIFSRLLNDSPQTIASKAIELVQAEESREVVQEMVLENISKQIKAAKSKIIKVLKNV